LPGSRVIVDGIQSAMQKARAAPAEIYQESIDAGHSPADSYEQRLAGLLEEKFRDIHFDLIIALTEPAATFMLRERPALFPRSPLLLGLIDPRMLDATRLPADTGVVFSKVDAQGTLRLALRAHPSIHQVLVVSGVSRFDRGWLAVVREDLRAFEKGVAISYDTNSTREQLLRRVQALSPNTIVLYTSMTRDAGGTSSRPVDMLEAMRAVSKAPIYGIASSNIGHGIVGGSLLDLDQHARDMGVQAVRMLSGDRPPPITTAATTVVDWRELRQFGIDPALLPDGTHVANRQLNLLERDRKGFIVGGLIVSVETALLVALVIVARRRREAQRLLRARLDFDTSLLDLIVALTSAPADRIAWTLEAELHRMSATLGIDRVRRWNFGDAAWDSPLLRASQPALLRSLSELPPDVQRELSAAAWRGGSGVAIPLAGGGVVFGALFCMCRDGATAWRAGQAELHILGTTAANVLERKRAEGQLEQSHRLRGSILQSLPANVAVVDRDGVIIAVNRFWKMFGQENGATSPAVFDEGANYRAVCLEGVRAGAEGAAQALVMIEAACRGEFNTDTIVYRCDSDTRKRWFEMTAVPLLRPEGGAIVKHLDVSEQKMTELALRESESRFRRMADAIPIAVWMSETDGRCSYVNQRWLDLTGRTFEQEAGIGWLDNVHPDDQDTSMDTYMRAFNLRETFSVEFRVRRHDGEFRWLLASGTPRYGADGAFLGFIGGCVDITERRGAELALRDVNRRLVLAQEDERRRIARELHDHLSQQLALLAIDLQQIGVGPPKTPDALREALQQAWGRTAEIASDVHAISHRLHPSKIEALGLAATIRAHCRDVSRQSLSVRFSEDPMPAGITPEVSLGLFRVLEEALTNVARHSGVREAQVSLLFDGHIVLRVADQGRGFRSSKDAPRGLGFVSMRERIEAMGGHLTVVSHPGQGTVIEARVPAPRAAAARQAAESA
jgi:PAS domain S-box-containing protein